MPSPSNTLLVDGHDIRTAFTGLIVIGDMNLYAPMTLRGNAQTINGRDGQIPVPGRPLESYAFQITVQVAGPTRGAKEARLRAVAAVLRGTAHDNQVAFIRRLANEADTGYDECTAIGEYIAGLSFALLNPKTGRTQLQFLNLSACWRNADMSIAPL